MLDTCAGIDRVLGRADWCLTDGFLPQPMVSAMCPEMLDLHRSCSFHRAGIDDPLEVRPAHRGRVSMIGWLKRRPGAA